MNVELFQKFAVLWRQKAELKAELKDVEQGLRDLSEPIQNALAEEGIANVPIAHLGKRYTVHPASTLRTRVHDGIDRDKCVSYLGILPDEWATLVRADFNLNAVSSQVRECLADGRTLPEGFRDLFDVYEDVQIKATVSDETESKSERAASALRGQ